LNTDIAADPHGTDLSPHEQGRTERLAGSEWSAGSDQCRTSVTVPPTRDRAHGAIGRSAWWLIGSFTVLRIFLAGALPLWPEEAYYWLWGRDLDWSYFDHPPLTSYSIALTTALFGTSAFGIKMAAVAWSLALNAVWARLIVDLYDDRRVLWWTLLALNLVGLYEAYGALSAPDAPLLFAWTATIWAVWRAAATRDGRWWYAAGFFLGLALLSKYSAILLVPAVALFLAASPRQRAWLARPEPYVGVAVALLVFAPVIVWNVQHGWASFAFQSTERAAGMGRWQPMLFARLVATQLAVVSPYLLGIALGAWFACVRGWRDTLQDDRRLLLFLSATIPLLLFTAASFRSLVKANWLAPAYWSLIILALQARLAHGESRRAMKIGLASSAALLVAAGLGLAWPQAPLGNADNWSGWAEAARRIEGLQGALAEQDERTFVFSTHYMGSALLAFYLTGHPRTYAQDVYGQRALQFDYWPVLDSMAGASGILALEGPANQAPPQQLARFFASVSKVDSLEIRPGTPNSRRIDLYLCRGYRGHPRAEHDG